MAVRPETLETPERGLDLETRDQQTPPVPEPEPEDEDEEESPAAVLQEVRERFGAHGRLSPPEGIGCRDCWHRGRAAVMAHVGPALLHPDPTAPPVEQLRAIAELVVTARKLEPKGRHWIACWRAGRDAAIEAIEGR